MTRITNELFESIRQITNPTIAEDNLSGNEIKEKKIHPNQQVLDVHEPEKDELTAKDFEMLRAGKKQKAVKPGVTEGRVDAAHFCATHVEHDLYGEGECISEAHADPDEHGNISWYTVQFADGVRKVQTEAVKVKKGKMHEHAEAEAESIEEVHMGNAGKVTMKQVNKSSASPAVKAAIKKAAPDIKTYSDRADALRAAGVQGAPSPRGTINASFEQVTELSTGTLLKVKHAAVRDANDATRDSDDARADKRYNLAGKASNKIELRNRAAGLKPSGQHALESVEQEEYTFADYLDAVRSQYGDEDAVLIANEAFKNKDITLFSDQSQSPEA